MIRVGQRCGCTKCSKSGGVYMAVLQYKGGYFEKPVGLDADMTYLCVHPGDFYSNLSILYTCSEYKGDLTFPTLEIYMYLVRSACKSTKIRHEEK